MKKIILLIFCFLGMRIILSYAGEVGTAGSAFLKIPIDARAIGMGEAYTALSDGASSLFWNPAGLSRVKFFDVSLMHNVWLLETAQEYGAIAYTKQGLGSFGISVNYFGSGSIMGMDEKGIPTGNFTASDIAIGAGYAKKIKEVISLGGQVKFLSEKNERENGTSFAVDFGGLYETSISGLKVGGGIFNLGGEMKLVTQGYSLPLTVRFGSSYTFSRLPLILALDVGISNEGNPMFSAGGEYVFGKILSLRTGYKTASNLHGFSGMRAGVGVRYKGIGLDYAFAPYGELGNSHRISVTYTGVRD